MTVRSIMWTICGLGQRLMKNNCKEKMRISNVVIKSVTLYGVEIREILEMSFG